MSFNKFNRIIFPGILSGLGIELGSGGFALSYFFAGARQSPRFGPPHHQESFRVVGAGNTSISIDLERHMANPFEQGLKITHPAPPHEAVELLRNFQRNSIESGTANPTSIRRSGIRIGKLPDARRHLCFYSVQRNKCLQAHIGEVQLRSFRGLKDRKAEQAG
jgi:hypothetical protein